MEGEIEPKSEAAKRTIPLLAILRDFLDEQLLRTGRTGTDRVFGRTADQVFYPSTIDGRAKRAWRARNLAEREGAEAEGRAPALLPSLTLHECRHTFASLLIDTGANAKAIQQVMGHSKIQTAPAARQLRRRAGSDGRVSRERRERTDGRKGSIGRFGDPGEELKRRISLSAGFLSSNFGNLLFRGRQGDVAQRNAGKLTSGPLGGFLFYLFHTRIGSGDLL
ncbi:MAG: tyrosine-type recombinase/integrase [Solirubrobacterales bacterium]